MNVVAALRSVFAMPSGENDEMDDMRDKLADLRARVDSEPCAFKRERMWQEIDKLRCQLRAT